MPHSNIASGRRISTSSNASSSVSMLSMATRSHRSSLYWLNPESLEKHADITLVAQSSPGDRRKMGAPAALLGAVSPYLRRLLANSWDQALDLVVHLDCTSSTLQCLIQLCMGQDVTSTNELLDWLKLLEISNVTLLSKCSFCDGDASVSKEELLRRAEHYLKEISRMFAYLISSKSKNSNKGPYTCPFCFTKVFQEYSDTSVDEVKKHNEGCFAKIKAVKSLLEEGKRCCQNDGDIPQEPPKKSLMVCEKCNRTFKKQIALNKHKCLPPNLNNTLVDNTPGNKTPTKDEKEKNLYELIESSENCFVGSCNRTLSRYHFLMHQEVKNLIEIEIPDTNPESFSCDICPIFETTGRREYISHLRYHWEKNLPKFFKKYHLIDLKMSGTPSSSRVSESFSADRSASESETNSHAGNSNEKSRNIFDMSTDSEGLEKRHKISKNSPASVSNSISSPTRSSRSAFEPYLENFPVQVQDNPRQSCLKCATVFKLLSHLSKHVCTIKVDGENSIPNLQCSLCCQNKPMTYASERDLKKHVIRAHYQQYFKGRFNGQEKAPCTGCKEKKAFRHVNELFIHHGIDHGNLEEAIRKDTRKASKELLSKLYPVARSSESESVASGSSTSSPKSLASRNKKSSGEEFTCQLCPKNFQTITFLRRHLTEGHFGPNLGKEVDEIRSKSDRPGFQCPLKSSDHGSGPCGKELKTKSTMMRHLGVVHKYVDKYLIERGLSIKKKVNWDNLEKPKKAASPPEKKETSSAKSSSGKPKHRKLQCAECLEVFATSELKQMHTCHSILDRKYIVDERRKRKSKDEASTAEAKKAKSSKPNPSKEMSSESEDSDCSLNKVEPEDLVNLSQALSDSEDSDSTTIDDQNTSGHLCNVCNTRFDNLRSFGEHMVKENHRNSDEDPW